MLTTNWCHNFLVCFICPEQREGHCPTSRPEVQIYSLVRKPFVLVIRGRILRGACFLPPPPYPHSWKELILMRNVLDVPLGRDSAMVLPYHLVLFCIFSVLILYPCSYLYCLVERESGNAHINNTYIQINCCSYNNTRVATSIVLNITTIGCEVCWT